MAAVLDDLLVAAASTPALAVSGLCRRLGDREVLASVDLTLARGEVVALMGAPGAGKSTLLRCMAGTEPFDLGTVSLRGRPPGKPEAWRRAVSWVFQVAPWRAQLGLGEQLMQLPALAGRDDAAVEAQDLLARVGLAGLFGEPLGQLSAAQRQRAAMAHALANHPTVLLCDDLTDPDDLEQAGEVGMAARALASEGLAVLLATHDAALARHADRVVVLREGRVQASGAPAEMLRAEPPPAWRRWFAAGAGAPAFTTQGGEQLPA